MIGRDPELAQLRATLRATVAGEGGSLVLTAPAGMGKTSLLTAVADEARALNLATATGRADERDRSAPLTTLRAALLQAQPETIDLAALAPGHAGGFWYLDQIAGILDDYVAQRPLVITIDDAQWTDEFSVSALRYLVPELASSALRWIIARRPGGGESAAHEAIEWLLEHGAARIDLGPMPEPAVAELCARVMGAVPDQTVLSLAGRADGNPFLLEQLLDTLLQSGQIVVSRSGVATVIGDELPSNFFAAVDQRLRGLRPETRRLLQAGAVLGRPFSIAAAARVIGQPITDLLDAADEALLSTILSEKDAELAFRHDLLREAVYNNISGPVRAAMHHEAAAVLRDERRSALAVADHLLRSGPTNDVQAVTELREAAALAAEQAPGAAATFILRAIELVGEHDPMRPQLSAEAVGLLAPAGRLVEAREIGEAALRSGLDAATEATVLHGLAEAAKHAGQNPLAIQYARRALLVAAVPDPIRAKLQAILAHSLMYGGDRRLADEAGAEAERLGQSSGEFSAAVWGLVARSTVARTEGRLADSLRHARAAVDLTDRTGGAVRQRHPRIWLGNALAAGDDFDEALAAYRDGQREAADLGTGWSLPLWHFVRASLLYWRGTLDLAEAEAEAGLAVAERLTARQLAVPLLGLLARAAAQRADQTQVEEHLTRMSRLLEDGVTAPPEDVAWTFAVCHDAAGESQAAYTALTPLYEALPDRLLLFSHDPGAAAVMVRLALPTAPERAAQVVAAMRALATANPTVASLAAGALHAEGLLTGELDPLRAAAAGYRSSPRALARASALEDAAAAAGKTAEGAELARAALAEYTACGAEVGVRRLSPRTASRRSGTVATGYDSFTPAERGVAQLVARGLSNRRVAAELYLSPHTVDSHLRHIFAKLQIKSRVELARYMADRESRG